MRAHSAIHVLAGAVVNVLGPTRFAPAQIGVLKVISANPLSTQDLQRIEAAANKKIAEDAEFLEFKMDREEAEGHFGPGIYDLVPVPEGGALLTIVRIPDWETSCCSEAHVESARAIGAITVDGVTFDDKKKELEVRFHLP